MSLTHTRLGSHIVPTCSPMGESEEPLRWPLPRLLPCCLPLRFLPLSDSSKFLDGGPAEGDASKPRDEGPDKEEWISLNSSSYIASKSS